MNKQQKLKIALPILIVVMAFVWGPVIFGSGSKSKGDNSTSRVNKNMQEGMSGFAVPSVASQKKAKTAYARWGSNPFMLKRTPKAINLEGILWDANDPKAIINGNIVGVGETVEGKMIVEIKANSVIIKGDDGEEFELKY